VGEWVCKLFAWLVTCLCMFVMLWEWALRNSHFEKFCVCKMFCWGNKTCSCVFLWLCVQNVLLRTWDLFVCVSVTVCAKYSAEDLRLVPVCFCDCVCKMFCWGLKTCFCVFMWLCVQNVLLNEMSSLALWAHPILCSAFFFSQTLTTHQFKTWTAGFLSQHTPPSAIFFFSQPFLFLLTDSSHAPVRNSCVKWFFHSTPHPPLFFSCHSLSPSYHSL